MNCFKYKGGNILSKREPPFVNRKFNQVQLILRDNIAIFKTTYIVFSMHQILMKLKDIRGFSNYLGGK